MAAVVRNEILRENQVPPHKKQNHSITGNTLQLVEETISLGDGGGNGGEAKEKSNAPLDLDVADADEQLKSNSTEANDVEIDETDSGISYVFCPIMSFSNSRSCCIKFRLGDMTPRFDLT